MRLLLSVCLVLVAFAANSVLNRLAVADGAAGPAAFAAVRMVSGAIALSALVAMRQRRLEASPGGVVSLAVYVMGFSYAYLTLETGMGALILFGGVQITMFAAAILSREEVTPLRWTGGAVAFGGLIYLLWPVGAGAPEPVGAALMAAAALGWGVYSLVGRGARDPLAATAGNFVFAAPVAVVAVVIWPDGIGWYGAALGVLAGVVTSGLGYALWYTVLPRLSRVVAAVAQLTVPVIALAGGVVFLGETASWRFVIAAVLVLGGVGLSAIAGRRRSPA